jgi:hypothetical protein
MDEELWQTGPSARSFIERGTAEALIRNGVNAASPLADDIRSRAAIVWPPLREPVIRVSDEMDRSLTLDAYIDNKKSDPAYASSFIPSPAKPRIRVTDQQALFDADLGMVARGEIEVIDDRKGRSR